MDSRRLIIPDIHGCAVTFRRMVEQVVRLTKADHLFLLGDLIDRGPRSKELLDFLLELSASEYNIHPLRGNHEQMLLDAYDSRAAFHLWVLNGGHATLDSFGINYPTEIPPVYTTFIRNFPYYIILEDFVLVHGGLNLEIDDPFSDTEAILWSRSTKKPKGRLGNKRLICGHTPSSRNAIRRSLTTEIVTLDNGCVFKDHSGLGNLVALELDTLTLHFQGNID